MFDFKFCFFKMKFSFQFCRKSKFSFKNYQKFVFFRFHLRRIKEIKMEASPRCTKNHVWCFSPTPPSAFSHLAHIYFPCGKMEIFSKAELQAKNTFCVSSATQKIEATFTFKFLTYTNAHAHSRASSHNGVAEEAKDV